MINIFVYYLTFWFFLFLLVLRKDNWFFFFLQEFQQSIFLTRIRWKRPMPCLILNWWNFLCRFFFPRCFFIFQKYVNFGFYFITFYIYHFLPKFGWKLFLDTTIHTQTRYPLYIPLTWPSTRFWSKIELVFGNETPWSCFAISAKLTFYSRRQHFFHLLINCLWWHINLIILLQFLLLRQN